MGMLGLVLSVSLSLMMFSVGLAGKAAHLVPDFDMQVLEMSSSRIRPGYLNCTCSPSSFTPPTDLVARMRRTLAQLKRSATATSDAQTALDACVIQHPLESCINAAALASKKPRDDLIDYRLASAQPPKALCTYDRITGRNLARDKRLQMAYITVGSCNEHRDMASRAPIALAANNPRIHLGIIECDCSPTSALPPLGALREMNATVGRSLGYTRSIMRECIRVFGRQSCADAERAFRTSRTSALCTYDEGSGRNMKKEGDKYVPVGTCSRSSANLVAKSGSATSQSKDSPNWHTEGCVDADLLQGYALQHRWHLRRRVFCHKGFCATPNHGILLRGEYTSMKRLCSTKWKCSSEVKLVNNLRWISNKRAVINDEITVLPFDYRFPWYAIVLVQFLHDALWLSLISSVTALILAFIFLVLFAIQKS